MLKINSGIENVMLKGQLMKKKEFIENELGEKFKLARAHETQIQDLNVENNMDFNRT